jgi:o-succinylbenzoate synthase
LFEEIILRPYELPLKQPWRAARAVLSTRRGLLIGLVGDGQTGWGDCAPLPSSGEAGHAKAFAEVTLAARDLRGVSREFARQGLNAVESREARWALETALRDHSARICGLSLRRSLNPSASDVLAVNVALGPLDEGCAERAAAALKQGFSVAKIKVGLRSVHDEAALLADIVARVGGGLRLRLDANRAWSEAEAERFCLGVADLPIDGLEEPLAEPTLDKLRLLQARAPFAIAIDESLFDLGPEAIFAARAVRRLVLKPARIGGYAATLALAEKAKATGMEVVVTSVVDSALGVAAAAQLAAAIDGGIAHGLATGSWLMRDVAPPLEIAEGVLRLSQGAGLGLVPTGDFAQG